MDEPACTASGLWARPKSVITARLSPSSPVTMTLPLLRSPWTTCFRCASANPAHNCSAVDVDAPQPEFAADLATAQVWRAEVRAGDLLFIPAWWFHTFEHLGELNSNVNFWWRPERPRHNAGAARQSLLDAAGQAELGERTPALLAALRALDAAAIQRTL